MSHDKKILNTEEQSRTVNADNNSAEQDLPPQEQPVTEASEEKKGEKSSSASANGRGNT